MSNLMTIGGVEVDLDQPCAVAAELRKVQIRVAAGETVSMARFGDDETRWSNTNAAGLAELIAHYQGLCERAAGRRRRFAAGIRFG